MPGRRPAKKGSFGGHFDELVKKFPQDGPVRPENAAERAKARKTDGSIHDRLFESAWRKVREGRHPSR
jgi:hypothetical protein